MFALLNNITTQKLKQDTVTYTQMQSNDAGRFRTSVSLSAGKKILSHPFSLCRYLYKRGAQLTSSLLMREIIGWGKSTKAVTGREGWNKPLFCQTVKKRIKKYNLPLLS